MKYRIISRAALRVCIAGLIIALASCSRIPESNIAAKKAKNAKALYLVDSFKSAALARNTLKENPYRPISIILPPSYYAKPESRYPVVYFLHGYKEVPGLLANNKNYIGKLMGEGIIPQMIIVEPDCTTKYGGGFYANSPVTGNYEDYLARELIAFIDANYRTISNSSARGISGCSMGGFGALAVGLRHSDRFGVVFAISPAILAPDGLSDAWAAWSKDHDFLDAYASVFSPLPSGKSAGRIPTLDGSPDDNALCALWYSGVGDWGDKIAAYSRLTAKLVAFKIAYSSYDNFPYIRAGSESLHAQLTALGVPHDFEVLTESVHPISLTLITKDLLPFMGRNLSPASE